MTNYFRQFVTLLQERPGHAISGKQAVGRIVIEARDSTARATVYIQDLSPQNTYKLVFVNKAGEINFGVVLGTIIVDEKGRYEGKFEFNRTSIGGSRINCEGIDACVIILGDGDEDFVAPLVGYRTQPFSWRVNLAFPDNKEDSPILEVKQVEEIEVTEEIQEASEVEEKITEVAQEEIQEEVPISVYNFETKDTETSNFESLFKNENIVDIFDGAGRFGVAQWVVTTSQEVMGQFTGKLGMEILHNPLVSECCEKHKHVLLGRNKSEGNTTYILGIPDIFDITSHAIGHELNNIFDSFKLCNPNDPVKGAHGYWLKQI